MSNHKPKGGHEDDTPGLGGLRAPAKGESSSSEVPREDDLATFIEPSKKEPSEPRGTRLPSDGAFDKRTPARFSGDVRSYGALYRDVSFQPGDLFGGRYEILAQLGEGGMGAVYKAADREVDRTVALKVIRPELASNPAILARFKQELLTAHQVTHKNVIRIYDLAEAEGVKFITMEFVEGTDLSKVLRERGKLPPEEAVEIIRQVCLALEAAHSAGIIHRDLKPQNIMQDNSGRILVMDFGLARTVGSEGMTQTGALLGTIAYMSPEQSLGKHLDQRSDLFAVGLIFYELLSGKTPFRAETAMASLLLRNQERAVPVRELDGSIPPGLSDIVSKSLERDLERRYQNAQEILHDLEAFQGARPTLASISLPIAVPVPSPTKPVLPWKWIVPSALTLLLGFGGWIYRGRVKPAGETVAPAAPQIALAILPFHNQTNDQSMDWLGQSLADMLSTDVGQSAHMRTISPDRLHQVFSDLRIQPSTNLDPQVVRRVAEFSNADTVVWGRYAKFGDQIRIDATLHDLKHDRQTPLKIEAPNEKAIPETVDKLAELIRTNLSVSSDVLKELKASSFQPGSKSVPALRDYNAGVQLLRDGKMTEAQKLFESATKEDPSFALAYSKLAQSYSGLGYDDQAEQAARKAVDLSQGLPEAEKYLIAAIQAQLTRNYPEAIKAYENLAKVSPDNTDVESALATLYERTGELAKASQYNQAVLKANPNDITAILTAGRLAINSGKPQEALDPLSRALTLSVQFDNQEQKANALHHIGVAYFRMDKPEEALRNFQEELGIWRKLGQKRGVAVSLNEMAKVQALSGDNKSALTNFQQALAMRREIGDKRGLGDTLIDMGNFYDDRGDHDQALKMYKEGLQVLRDIGEESLQATCLNNIGAVYFEKAQYEDARTYYQQALQLREKTKVPGEIVQTVQNLADTAVRMGQYDQALPQYMRALELWRSANDTKGAAITAYTLGVMFGYQGRFGAAVNSMQDAFKTFQDQKDKTITTAEIAGGYGESLILAGRGEEAKTPLNDALNLSRELKNDGVLSQNLVFQGDLPYYSGDLKSARALYEQALTAANRSKEPERILLAKVGLAKIAAQEEPKQQTIINLRQLIEQADELGLQNVSVACSLSIAEAMIHNHDNAHAQQELERALLRADKIGLKPQSAKAHYLLGNTLRTADNQAESQRHYRDAVQLLDSMRQEAGADKILQRSDFKTMYEEATHWSQAAKG
jgi:serine/threonine protein kinase/tetratricopeptide (TPR) repeat protein